MRLISLGPRRRKSWHWPVLNDPTPWCTLKERASASNNNAVAKVQAVKG